MSNISIPKDFFQQQDDARKRSRLLIFYFVLVLLLMIAGTYIIFLFLPSILTFGKTSGPRNNPFFGLAELKYGFWSPQLLALSSLVGGGAILAGSSIRMLQIREGGASVAKSLGGVQLFQDSTSIDHQKVLNVVEEMAIASGMPVPPVYLLSNELSINAFAAGFTTRDAVIGVSQGALDKLDREELQGVIAHEFSHILNGDMRLNLKMIALLFGIYSFYLLGRVILESSHRTAYRSRRNQRDGGGHLALGLLLCFFGMFGVFWGRLIKAALSRQREYLADASAVQFTRNPDGIAGALKKILFNNSYFKDKHKAEEISHMFFTEALRPAFLQGYFATHPPLKKRILAISPSADLGESKTANVSSYRKSKSQSHASSSFLSTPVAASTSRNKTSADLSSSLIETMGSPDGDHIDYFNSLNFSMPKKLSEKIKEPHGAYAIVLALLLDTQNSNILKKQVFFLKTNLKMGLFEETLRAVSLLEGVSLKHKLPILEMCIPALRSLSSIQYQHLRAFVKGLSEADEKYNLFEYVLHVVLLRNLDPNYLAYRKKRKENKSLTDVSEDVCTVLSVLAASSESFLQQGHASSSEKAYFAGAEEVSLSLSFKDKGLSLKSLDKALISLSELSPISKKLLLKASIKVISFDSKTSIAELELLRAIYESLDCPIPPILLKEHL